VRFRCALPYKFYQHHSVKNKHFRIIEMECLQAEGEYAEALQNYYEAAIRS
jgi:hypothetical protein